MVVDELVQFEENSEVLSFRFDYKNMLIWPYIRQLLFRTITDNELGIIYAREKSEKSFNWKHYWKYNSFNLKSSDVMFIRPDAGYIKENGKYIDRVVGDYMDLVDNCARFLQYNNKLDISELNGNVKSDVFIKKIIEYEACFREKPLEEDNNIDKMLQYLKEKLPFKVEEGIYISLKKKLQKVISEFPYYYKYYGHLMDIVKPKIVFCNCAMYGNPLIKVLNDRKIVTAEFQHGYIGRGHDTYNYAKKVAENKEYKTYMPQFFLTYGEYWTREILVPSQVKVIGNPIVSRNIEESIKKKKDVCKNQILLIATIQYELYVKFVREMLKYLPKEYTIVIKLHPLFVKDKEYFEEFFDNERVSFRGKENIYDCINESQYIIGDTSTALYEAAALGKTIFIMDGLRTRILTSKNLGIWVNSGKEISDFLLKNACVKGEENIYFCMEWRKKYIDFLEMNGCTI